MMNKRSRKGYALIEAMLSLTLIGGGMAWKAKIDSNYQKDQQVKGVVEAVDSFIYGVDKRVLLDGATWTGGEGSSDNSVDSYALIKKTLVGSADASCSGGGWTAAHADNSKTSLINCYDLNPHNMPFGLNMAVSMTQVAKSSDPTNPSPLNSLKKFSVTLFYSSDEKFEKNLNVFLKLYSYSKTMSSPRITGSHKYSLVDMGTGNQITMSQCTTIKSKCGFMSEYVSNEDGLSESPYLMVNGDNFMIDNLKFQDGKDPSTALSCSSVDDSGVVKTVPCGLNLITPATSAENSTLNEVSTNSINRGFYLVDGDPAIKLNCSDETGVQKACGMVAVGGKGVLRINSIIVDDLNSKNIVFSKKLSSSNDLFNVDGVTGDVQGNDIWGTGSIHSKTSIFTDADRSGGHHSAELGASGLYKKGDTGTHLNINADGSIEANGGAIRLNGAIATTDVAHGDRDYTNLNQYVTKDFLSRYSQIIFMSNDFSGHQKRRHWMNWFHRVPVTRPQCLGSRTMKFIFIPSEMPVRSAQLDNMRCANTFGQRLAKWSLELVEGSQEQNTSDNAGINRRYGVRLGAHVGCTLSRDTWLRWGVKDVNLTNSGIQYTPYMEVIDYNGSNAKRLDVQAKGTVMAIC